MSPPIDLSKNRSKRYPTSSVLASNPMFSLLCGLIVFEIAFFFAYRYGMVFPEAFPAPVWFPDSVLLCALLLSPRNTWWIYIAATLPIRLFVAVPVWAPAWFLPACFVNDSLKGLLAAWFLRRESRPDTWFDDLNGFVRYGLVAILLAPALSAFAGAATHMAARGSDFWTAWKPWFLGNALANLLLTPALFCLVRDFRSFGRMKLPHWIEAFLVAAGLIFSGYLAFHRGLSVVGYSPFLLYLPVPFLLWAAFRLGPLGASVALSVVSVLAVVGTLYGQGPLSEKAAASSSLEIQLFAFVLSMPFLFLSVLVAERRTAEERLRQLTGQLINVQEAERYRIAQELHDDLGQRAVALSFGLNRVALRVSKNKDLATDCAELQQQLTDICRDISHLSHELRPIVLETLGLSGALESLCEKSMDASGVEVIFAAQGDLSSIPWDVAIALYRVAQEALRNALTHSGSERIEVRLDASTSGIDLSVTDNGRGFAIESRKRIGLGLSGMEERMKNAGGELRITSARGAGTTVTASVFFTNRVKSALAPAG
jgi:two-component system sensor histidine kinase UhpB